MAMCSSATRKKKRKKKREKAMQRTKYVGSFLKNHAAIASGKVVAYVRRGRESNSLNRRLMVREARRFTSGRRKQTKEKNAFSSKEKGGFHTCAAKQPLSTPVRLYLCGTTLSTRKSNSNGSSRTNYGGPARRR